MAAWPPLPACGTVVDIAIHHVTVFGQQVAVQTTASSGGAPPPGLMHLRYTDHHVWRGRVTLAPGASWAYKYVLMHDTGSTQPEWGEPRVIRIPAEGAQAASAPCASARLSRGTAAPNGGSSRGQQASRDAESATTHAAATVVPLHIELRETFRAPGFDRMLHQPTLTAVVSGRAQRGAAKPCATGCGEWMLPASALAKPPPQPWPTHTAGTAFAGWDRIFVRLQVLQPRVPAGYRLVACGSVPQLGSWNPDSAPSMDDSNFPTWTLTVEVSPLQMPLEYKYVMLPDAAATRTTVAAAAAASPAWEDGDNRQVHLPDFVRRSVLAPTIDDSELFTTPQEYVGRVDGSGAGATAAPALRDAAGTLQSGGTAVPTAPVTVLVVSDDGVRLHSRPWRAAGVAVPLPALRSTRGHGVGEFTDVPRFVEWAHAAGFHLIQLLPINDTFVSGQVEETNPFRAISSFALHPLFLGLDGAVETIESAAADAPLRRGQFPLASSPDTLPQSSSEHASRADHATAPTHTPDTAHASDASATSSNSACSGSSTPAPELSVCDLGCSSGQGNISGPTPWRIPSDVQARISAARKQLNADAIASSLHSVGSAGGAGSPPLARASSAAQRGQAFGSSWSEMQGGGSSDRAAGLRSPLDYEAVIRTKMSLLRELYRIGGDEVLGSRDFSRFFRENSDWLQPYALWRFFSELHGAADPAAWGARASIAHAAVQALVDPSCLHYRAIAFWYFVQYLLHVQAAAAARHAREHGVVLQVQVAAGLPRLAADVWVAPHLFKKDRSLGAPPDMFARDGQNWKFPPYDWPAMQKEGYSWWQRRYVVS